MPDWTGDKRIDQRSIAMHLAIAAKLPANPDLLNIARENFDRWSLTSRRRTLLPSLARDPYATC